jgi:hypothetical protein
MLLVCLSIRSCSHYAWLFLLSAQLRRASVLKDESNLQVSPDQASEQDFLMHDNDNDMGNIPFEDEEEEEVPVAGGASTGRLSSFNLSMSRDESSRGNAAALIGGLEDEEEEASTTLKKRGSSLGGTKRNRKKRKVAIDDQTELRGAEIKKRLDDTSDIVLHDVVHPATWVHGQENASFKQTDKELLFSHLSYEKLFSRPSAGDDGQLAPELLKLWARNTAPVLGKPFPYILREEDEKEADVEVARQNRVSLEDDEQHLPMDDEADFPPPPGEDEQAPPADGDDVAIMFDNDDDVPPGEDIGYGNDVDMFDKSMFSRPCFAHVLV